MADIDWYCDPSIEDCATDDIIRGEYDDLTPYIIYGTLVYF